MLMFLVAVIVASCLAVPQFNTKWTPFYVTQKENSNAELFRHLAVPVMDQMHIRTITKGETNKEKHTDNKQDNTKFSSRDFSGSVPKVCGYESCPDLDTNVLNVHLVPHTHNDVGWVRTIDQYYFESVEQIINSVINELKKDPSRRFIYVETAFFWMWWKRQTILQQEIVRALVQQGRLQFVSGAWSMNDEANTHYQSIIDQFTYGLKKLRDTFGYCGVPRTGWQIDPFGHSREYASLLAAMGYDGYILSRVHGQDLEVMKKKKLLEMVWRGNDDLGNASDIFTSVLYSNSYTPPNELYFDEHDPFSTDMDTQLIRMFIEIINHYARSYATKNIILTIGGDFAYKNAYAWYQKMDALIQKTNNAALREGLKINVLYSTPDCYVKAVKKSNPTLPVKQDDFFPYANSPGNYWTGYYTTRPTVKRLEREGNSILQMVKQLQVTAMLDERHNDIVDRLKSAMGVLQHHDAITGTHTETVSFDYIRIIDNATADSLLITKQALNRITQITETPYGFDRCRLEMSECSISENSQQFMVTVYNPLAWTLKVVPVRVPVAYGTFQVFDSDGAEIPYNLALIPDLVIQVDERISAATQEIVFFAKNLQPLGIRSFFIKMEPTTNKLTKYLKPTDVHAKSRLQLKLGTDKEVTHIVCEDGTTILFKIEFLYYNSERNSGAYVFMPKKDPVIITTNTLEYYKGRIVHELHYSSTNDRVSGVLRIYQHEEINYIEHDWIVAPIELDDKQEWSNGGREIVVRYRTDISNNRTFFTDSNGRQMIRRILDDDDKSVQANYYPVVSKVYIEDKMKRFTVLTDRAEGGTSMHDGEIELMLNRRVHGNDDLGMYELLDCRDTERGKHRIIILNPNDRTKRILERERTFEFHLQPQVFISNSMHVNMTKWLSLSNWIGPLNGDLPEGLHLLTLEQWSATEILLRLENYYELSDGGQTSVKLDLSDLFTELKLLAMRETKLAANMWVNEGNKFNWKVKKQFFNNFNDAFGGIDSSSAKPITHDHDDEAFTVELHAKEIRTFIIAYSQT